MIAFMKTWCLAICLCAVVCAVCETFVGTGKLKNSIRFVTAAFAMICFLAPLLDRHIDETFAADAVTYSLDEEKIKETYLDSVAATFEKYLQSNFDKTAAVGKIYTLKDENGNIYITEVTVESKLDDDTLEEIIRKEFGKNACLLRR